MINFQGVSKRTTDIKEFETILTNILSDDRLKNKCDFSIKSKLISTKEIFKIRKLDKVIKSVNVGLGLFGDTDFSVITIVIPIEPEKIEVMIDRAYGVHFYITVNMEVTEIYIDIQETMFIKDFDFELTQVTRSRKV